MGISRSRLYSRAVELFVADHQSQEVTERLDNLYGDEAARVDPLLETLQIATLDSEDW